MGHEAKRGAGGRRWIRLPLRTQCDCDCVFCHPSPARGTSPLADVLRFLGEHARPDTSLLVGGEEPTTYPHLAEVVARARELGFARVRLQTTALAFATAGLAERLREAGLEGVNVPIYGVDPAVHDAVTRTPGSGARLLAALARLTAAGLGTLLHTVVTRHNVTHLPDLLRGCAERDVPLRRIEQLQPDHNFDYPGLAVSLTEVARTLSAADPAHLRGVVLGNFPPCFTELLPAPLRAEEYLRADNGWNDRLRRKTHAPACADCAARERCAGLFERYREIYGDGELSPR